MSRYKNSPSPRGLKADEPGCLEYFGVYRGIGSSKGTDKFLNLLKRETREASPSIAPVQHGLVGLPLARRVL